jgi:membrane peptidoglycan carboxypeptidase
MEWQWPALRGASTISQQLVKNLFLSNERSFGRKFIEALYTLRLEKMFSKDQILTFYLNVIELGEGVYGVSEASRFYFDKEAKKLSIEESLLLALLIPDSQERGKRLAARDLNAADDRTVRRVLYRTQFVLEFLRVNKGDEEVTLEDVLDPLLWKIVQEIDFTDYSNGARYASRQSYQKILGMVQFSRS